MSESEYCLVGPFANYWQLIILDPQVVFSSFLKNAKIKLNGLLFEASLDPAVL